MKTVRIASILMVLGLMVVMILASIKANESASDRNFRVEGIRVPVDTSAGNVVVYCAVLIDHVGAPVAISCR